MDAGEAEQSMLKDRQHPPSNDAPAQGEVVRPIMARTTCECACRPKRWEDARPLSVDEHFSPLITLVLMDLADPEGVLLQPSPSAGEPPLV
jgi:hypothetical protein